MTPALQPTTFTTFVSRQGETLTTPNYTKLHLVLSISLHIHLDEIKVRHLYNGLPYPKVHEK